MKLAITIGLCVLAFVVGRQWPGREPAPTSAAPASAAETGARSTPSARASVRSRGVDRVTPARDERATIPTDRYDTAYLEAWRQDRAGAGRAKVAVLETLEVRRRAHDPALRACLETAGIHGLVKLRFSVTVESTPAELRVGAASLIEVVEGQPVPTPPAAVSSASWPATTSCRATKPAIFSMATRAASTTSRRSSCADQSSIDS